MSKPFVEVLCKHGILYVQFSELGDNVHTFEMEYTGSGPEPLPMDVARIVHRMAEKEGPADFSALLWRQRFILDYVLLVPREDLEYLKPAGK